MVAGFWVGMAVDRSDARGTDVFADDSACLGLVADAKRALADSVHNHDLSRARDALRLLDRASKLCPDDIKIPFLEGLVQSKLNDQDGVKAAMKTWVQSHAG